MAQRSETGGSAFGQKPISYEDFQPLAEWGEDKENHFLTIHLPGFRKEQITVNCVRSARTIRFQGERQLAISRWSRFNQSFTLPDNCNLEKIEARWQNEVLTATMPKLQPTPVAKPSEESQKLKQEQAQAPPKAEQKPDKEMKQEQAQAPPKPEQKPDKEMKQEQAQVPPKAEQKPEKEAKPEKGQEEAAPSTTMKKQEDKKSDQVVKAEIGLPKRTVSSEKRKEKIGTEKEEKSGEASKGKDLKEMKSVTAAALKAVKGFSMENKEDRQKIINVGVAVLVLVALGAYVSYSIKSKQK